VVHANAADRSGTHAAKTRAFVSGTGKKPWKQKGTGRAQVGSSRTPLWRHGGTVHPPRPRSYDFKLSKKVERGALRAALAAKVKEGEIVVVEALSAEAIKTKAAAELLRRIGVTGKAVLVDVAADDKLSRSLRNIPGVSLVASARLTAREVIGAGHVVATKGALEKLQEALA
jgi:large subunit ribosomal protein L4